MRRELGLAATMGTALALAGAIVVAANWSFGDAPVEEAAAEAAPSALSDARRVVRNGRVQQTGDGAGALAAREPGRGAGALAAQPPSQRAAGGDDDDDGDDDD